jgi:hypothetical protein
LAPFLHLGLLTFFFTLFISMSLPYPTPPLAFLRCVSRIHRPAHGAMRSLPEYIDERAALLTPEHRSALLWALPLLRIQFAGLTAPGFPHLPAQLKLLTDFLQDSADAVFLKASEAAQREAALALRYVAHNTDVLPDQPPENRHADDSLLVRAVLRRHRKVFRDYCRFRRIRWSTVTLVR